jgi:hypothetical protein
MWIFIRGIPTNASRKTLGQFVTSGMRRGLLGLLPLLNKGTLRHCDLLNITDQDTGAVERHGLVEVEPAEAAKQVIHRLNGRPYLGKPVMVRRYFHRSDHRDRRHNIDLGIEEELRRCDRRRANLQIDIGQVARTVGLDNYARTRI